MRLPFCILNVRGDMLDDGEIHFIGATQTLKAARLRIEALAKLSPGQYVIYNGETGERLPLIGKTRKSQLAKAARSESHSSGSFRTTL